LVPACDLSQFESTATAVVFLGQFFKGSPNGIGFPSLYNGLELLDGEGLFRNEQKAFEDIF
jgi:hypothetical protein